MPIPDISSIAKQYIRRLIAGDDRTAYYQLSLVADGELFRALAVPSRDEVDDLFESEPGDVPGFSSDIPGPGPYMSPWARTTAAAASMGGKVLERQPKMTYAYHVVGAGKLKFAHDAAPPDGASQVAANDYIHHCVAIKDIPLDLDEDLTDELPDPSPVVSALTDADFTNAAGTLGVDVPALRAVAQVESAGSGFGRDGHPVIRYELHRFQAKTHRQFHKTHPHLSQPDWHAGDRYHNGTQNREYSLLYSAMLLKYQGDRAVEEAIESTSWGKFQIMGENWSDLGWDSALAFASDMYVSEANHLDAFVKFVQFKGITNALRNHQWATFALHYNGKNFADNDYDGRLQRAFNRFQRQAAGAQP
jgi:hypothetical protein